MKNKKSLYIIISVCLVVAIVTGVVLMGCAGLFGRREGEIKIPVEQEEKIEYTNYKLVDNGKSDYKIVVKDEVSYDEEIASLEIEELFEESTSITLSTVAESEVTYGENSKLIILGDTEFSQYANVDVTEIAHDGFIVKTVDSNLFILGKDSGVVYGAHEFLKKAIGFEYYVKDVYALDKNVTNLYMPKLDISESPDIPNRIDAWRAENNEQGSYRARIRNIEDYFLRDEDGGMYFVHNTFSWLNPKTYQKAHPDWYADDDSQLCYTAHGNEEELASMQEEVLKRMKYVVSTNFSKGKFKTALSFTQQDSSANTWCTCDACKRDLTNYGASSSSLIKFINPVASELNDWLEETWPNHEVTIVVFAYQATEIAPVKTENGKYVPIDDSVKLEDNVSIWLAPIHGDFIRNVDNVNNASVKAMFEKWSAITNNFFVWTYDTNFLNYMIWYDTFNALPDLYRFLRSNNAQFVFNQGQIYSGSNYTSFDIFKIALNYKLMWDADTNVKRFTDNFFDTYFGLASKDMREYYESFRSWSEYLKTEKNLYGHIYMSTFTKDEYPKQVLYGWLENVNNAYASIESLKTTSPEEYSTYYDRITAESIAIRYALIQIHGESDRKLDFKNDATRLKFTKKGEGVEITELWNTWGI